MEERFAPRDLVDDEALRALSRRSDARGLTHLAGHIAVLIATGTAVWLTRGTFWAIATVPLYGAALIFLFAPLHETIHRTAFRRRWLNDAVSQVAGFVLVLPPDWFRAFHFAHHRWTQDPARDPELDPPRPTSRRAWLWYVSGIPYWIAAFRGLFGRTLGRGNDPFVGPRDRKLVRTEARRYLVLYAATAVAAAIFDGWAALIWLWLLPVFVAQPLLRLYLLAEHGNCALMPDMLRNTRTTLTTAPVRFVAWNMPYHAEHHAFPGVPFHALPMLHARLKPHLAVIGRGYIATSVELFQTVAGRQSRANYTSDS